MKIKFCGSFDMKDFEDDEKSKKEEQQIEKIIERKIQNFIDNGVEGEDYDINGSGEDKIYSIRTNKLAKFIKTLLD